MIPQLGARIRALRIEQGLLLRQLAATLNMDTALLSKIERGERSIKKEQVPQIAQVLKATKEELLTLWLADQVMDVLKDEKLADEALKTVSKNIKKKY
ncbi:MAG: XRE family transcriptional regulator [Sphingobacteriales bacterium]|nr:MAG: XRE family transcriptional regulator [Sphingobacteriales bacterium]